MSFALACKTFVRILGDADLAAKIRALLEPGGAAPEAAPRSDALTLLAALQREARLVDFLMEPLDGYGDAQVGAAARDVHRDAAKTLARLFAPEPLRAEPEGDELAVAAGYDPAQIQLTGNVAGEPPHRGVLRHPGWRATRCEVPSWSGGEDAARVLAPAEVEVR